MLREYTLQGLGCANCANKIEYAVQKLDGVSSGTVNFLTGTLRVETAENYRKDLTPEIEKIVHLYEPEVVVTAKKATLRQQAPLSDQKTRSQLLILLVGAVILGIGIFLEYFGTLDERFLPAILLPAYLLLGGKVIWRAGSNIRRGQIFDENFLMSVATIGALLIGQYSEAVAVMLFYQTGEFFQDLAVRKSKKSITDLMDIRPDFANLSVDGEIKKVAPATVRVGDTIVVKPGEKIPLDGIVLEGEALLDTTALTGESKPRSVSVSDPVLSGCINQNGLLTIEVTKSFGESTVAKIIDLVENAASKKAPTENFITTFSRYYTPVVVGAAVLIAVIPPLFTGAAWLDWINRGLIFLVISCPCALVISIPLGFFGGIGRASKRGVLVKGSNYLEALNHLDLVVFDKTGTLTKGVFQVSRIYPAPGFSEEKLLEITARAESFSNHPIALSIRQAYGQEVNQDRLTDYREITGHGLSVSMDEEIVLAGNAKLMLKEGISFSEVPDIGTKIYVAVAGQLAGCLVISDAIKPDSYRAIAALKKRGVRKTVMLTGDNEQTAAAIAQELNLDAFYAGLLPEQKVEQMERLDQEKRPQGKLAFVGDGINDAPVLARADVGIAMGGLGSDAAIEAADVVLMTDEPSKLAEAMDIARATKRIVWQNIVFVLLIKAIFLTLGALGLATMWSAVFADVGALLLAVLNTMRILKGGRESLSDSDTQQLLEKAAG